MLSLYFTEQGVLFTEGQNWPCTEGWYTNLGKSTRKKKRCTEQIRDMKAIINQGVTQQIYCLGALSHPVLRSPLGLNRGNGWASVLKT